MTEFLIRHFVKDYEQTEKVSVRTQYGTLRRWWASSAMCCSLRQGGDRTSDAQHLRHSGRVNNLSDAASSVIGLIGVKMAGKPADSEHPFGHGRMEYITALVVSFLVIEVGFTFFKDAIGRIREPQPWNLAWSLC